MSDHAQAFFPLLAHSATRSLIPRVVNISSVAGIIGVPNMSACAVTSQSPSSPLIPLPFSRMITNQVLRQQMGARRLERQHQARVSLLGHQSQPTARIASASDAIRARSTVNTALCLRAPQSRLRFSAQPCANVTAALRSVLSSPVSCARPSWAMPSRSWTAFGKHYRPTHRCRAFCALVFRSFK